MNLNHEHFDCEHRRMNSVLSLEVEVFRSRLIYLACCAGFPFLVPGCADSIPRVERRCLPAILA
jgi:hypothetical protein